jgi:hypothetical protein
MSANVQSLTAISEFRAALCTFMVEARQALAALEMEARRAVDYITHDQAQHWGSEVRRGREQVQQRKLDIHNTRTFKRIGEYVPSCIDEKKELAKAERRLHLAEIKVEAVRHWGRVAEQAFREFQARLAQFVGILDGELPKATAKLERMLASLDRYMAVQAPSAARELAEAASGKPQSKATIGDDRSDVSRAEEAATAATVSPDADELVVAAHAPCAAPTSDESAITSAEEQR